MLTMDERHELIERLIRAVQVYRSNVAETLGDTHGLAEDLQPWSMGGQLMPVLLRLAEQDHIAPMDMFNVLTVAYRLAPELRMAYFIIAREELPEPMAYLQTALKEAEDE